MKVIDVIRNYETELSPLYERGELAVIISLAFEAVKGFSRADMTFRKNEGVTTKEAYELGKILHDLKQNRPIQYVLGYAWFHGLKFFVNENVLIPRPETEELVSTVLTQISGFQFLPAGRQGPISILDIGTGSGCIAIALKKKFSAANVSALDVSEEALAVAKRNAEANNAQIHFIHDNILNLRTTNYEPQTTYDIIVSNPPYVLHSDKPTLHERVIRHEPELALFAAENDALIFYRAIADFALQHLKPHGFLFIEIHETKGSEVKELLRSKGFSSAEIIKDMSGKDRIAKAGL